MVRRGLGLVTLISILVIVSLFIAASVSGQDVTTQNATVVDRVELPDEIKETTLLAWNKGYMWQIGEIDYNATVNKIRPSDGKIVHRINLPDSVIGPEGLVVSNDSLWLLNNANAGQQREVYKIDLSTGKVDRTIPVAVARSEGLAYDGEYFWTHNSDSEKFVKIDPETGETVEEVDASSLNGYAYVKTLTWGSGFLWAGGTERITQIDISDDTANVAGAYSGKTIEPALMVAWDGEYMWSNSDAVNLVRLDVGDIGEPNNPPNTSFSYSPTKPAAGQEVSLDASGSSDSEGYIAQYQWDFDGDGVSEARGEQVTHTFDSTGQHTIELTVVDNNEATSKINKTIKITQRTSTTDVVQSTSAASTTTEKTTDETKSVSSTDPPESPSETVTRNTVTNMPTEERSSSAEPPSSSNEVQRGFFSNGPNSGSLDPLANPFLLTLGGFIFSAAGILLQLSRGG